MSVPTLIVIPARMASTRFPGKPLIELQGKPMIQWVYETTVRANIANEIVIAAPDDDILKCADSFGAKSILTAMNHQSGTDRITEVIEKMSWEGIVINVQGDEPLIPTEAIQICKGLLEDSRAQMGSLFTEMKEEDVDNPSVVKTVTDLENFALYFSRYPIPFLRSGNTASKKLAHCKRHVGIYSYRADVLREFQKWKQTELELAESLEQLRFLEHGVKIKMGMINDFPTGVDTPEQAEKVRKYLLAYRH